MKIDSNLAVNLFYYPNKIVLVKDILYKKSGKVDRAAIMKSNRKTVYNGFMSNATERKVSRIITAWAESVNRENNYRSSNGLPKERMLVFVTLSLSDEQVHDDNWIKRNMLNKFIIEMNRKWNVKHYLWRAEKMKNGRIHFHIIIDKFVDYQQIQLLWNKIQSENGYTQTYENKFNKTNPPSTHVRKASSSSELLEYIIKYVTKNKEIVENNKLKIKGRIWGCSDSLRNLKVYTETENSEVITEIYKQIYNHKIKSFEDDFYLVVNVDTERFLREIKSNTIGKMYGYYWKLYEKLYSNQNPYQTEENEPCFITQMKKKQEQTAIQLDLFKFNYTNYSPDH